MAISDHLSVFRLDGRTVLITGPVRGIGLGIARLFAGAGARLVLADLDGPACDVLADELRGVGAGVVEDRHSAADRVAIGPLGDR